MIATGLIECEICEEPIPFHAIQPEVRFTVDGSGDAAFAEVERVEFLFLDERMRPVARGVQHPECVNCRARRT